MEHIKLTDTRLGRLGLTLVKPNIYPSGSPFPRREGGWGVRFSEETQQALDGVGFRCRSTQAT
jgi:hypothetical protein